MALKPSADQAERNRATLRALAKHVDNRFCADCKVNKHPRWASWNLGVFVCIRCSGIHRSLGVHISKVKSVDLDTWTDEQLASMVRWGNRHANGYWEAKMKADHVPSDAKIASFIRTKYETRRWAMECTPLEAISAFASGPDGQSGAVEASRDDDDLPLSVVRERALSNPRSQPAIAAAGDLLGFAPPPAAGGAAGFSASRRPADPLSGLDILSHSRTATPPPQPTQQTNTREDLKRSILSLYASQPTKPVTPPIPAASPPQQDTVADAFSGLSLVSPRAPPARVPSVGSSSGDLLGLSFSGSGTGSRTGSVTTSASAISHTTPKADLPSLSSAFTLSASKPSHAAPPPVRSAMSSFSDSLNPWASGSISAPSAAPAPVRPTPASIMNPISHSAGLSRTTVPSSSLISDMTTSAFPSSTKPVMNNNAGLSKMDALMAEGSPWGSETAKPSVPVDHTPAPAPTSSWKSSVAADEDFSDWASAVPPAASTTNVPSFSASKGTSKLAAPSSGLDDLYGNVWS